MIQFVRPMYRFQMRERDDRERWTDLTGERSAGHRLSNRQNEVVDGCRNEGVAIIIDFHAGNRGRCNVDADSFPATR